MVDPYDNATGLRFPRTLEAQLTLVSHEGEDASNTEAVLSKPFVIDMPGEFEVGGVFVYAISAPREGDKSSHRIFLMESEEMHIAHLGALNRTLSDDELGQLKNVDVLILPVGGKRVMSPSVAEEVIGQLEPRMVVPMTYAIDGVKESLGGLPEFLKVLGPVRKEEATKLKLARKDLPEEDMVVAVLSRA